MTKVMISLPTSLLIFLAIEQTDMGDITAFRERFNAYKNGKSVSEIYDAGLPKYANGTEGNIPAHQRFVEEMGPVLFNEMIAQGVKNPKAAYKNMITQLAYESNYGQSRVAREQNNFGGVGWNGKTYTTYKDKADFAKNYVRLMNSRYKNVIGADTLAGYAKGLKSLNYYGDTVENYTRNLVGMKSFAKALSAHMSNNPDLYNQQIPAQEPSPYIAKPVSTAVRSTIPAEQTVPAYDTKISPYISGKPMLKLRPRVQLPNLIEVMEDSEWEPPFQLTPRGYKNGKLPGYYTGKYDDDTYKKMVYGRNDIDDKQPQYQRFVDKGTPKEVALRWTKDLVDSYPESYYLEGPTLPEVTVKPDPNSMSTALLTTYYPWSVEFPVTGHSTLELIHDDEGSSGFVTAYMSDPWYNFITNNCSDATRNAIESATGKKINPMFFTTPGDVKDFVENNLGGKSKYDRRGFSETVFDIPTKQARKIVEYARKQSAIIHKMKHRE